METCATRVPECIEHVKKKAAELAEKAPPEGREQAKEAPRDNQGNLRRPGRAAGDRP